MVQLKGEFGRLLDEEIVFKAVETCAKQLTHLLGGLQVVVHVFVSHDRVAEQVFSWSFHGRKPFFIKYTTF